MGVVFTDDRVGSALEKIDASTLTRVRKYSEQFVDFSIKHWEM